MIAFYQYLFEKFRKPAKHNPLTYIITTTYCNIALNQIKGDCIIYPSVQSVEEGLNFAIKKSFINSKNISLEHVMCNEMVVLDAGKHLIEGDSWFNKRVDNIQDRIFW